MNRAMPLSSGSRTKRCSCEGIGSNAVEVYIHGLRRKLGSGAIRTLRGVGYFVPK